MARDKKEVALLIDEFVQCLDEYVEEKIRERTTSNPYYGGQVYDCQKKLAEILAKLIS